MDQELGGIAVRGVAHLVRAPLPVNLNDERAVQVVAFQIGVAPHACPPLYLIDSIIWGFSRRDRILQNMNISKKSKYTFREIKCAFGKIYGVLF